MFDASIAHFSVFFALRGLYIASITLLVRGLEGLAREDTLNREAEVLADAEGEVEVGIAVKGEGPVEGAGEVTV